MRFITVSIMQRSRSPHWLAYWVDPITERKKTKSLKTTDERTAQRRSQQLETEINSGKSQEAETTWLTAIAAYRLGAFPALSQASRSSIETTITEVERHMNPKSLAIFTDQRVSEFAAVLRKTPERGKIRTEFTIKRHLSTLRAILNWFGDSGYIQRVPKFRMPNPRGSKGRPITDTEFAAMLAQIPDVTGNDPNVTASWEHLLWGLWLSGLRLSEALELSWDDPHKIRVDLTTYRHPMLVLPGASQKNRTDQIVPITPDFADWLIGQPVRAGDVFSPLARSLDRIDMEWASRIISRCGKMAQIVTKKESEKEKYASAHDLRRSFGDRWSRKVLPALLQLLMRHSDIKTTMSFYLGRNAETSADQLYATVAADNQLGGVSGGSQLSKPQSKPAKRQKTLKNSEKTITPRGI